MPPRGWQIRIQDILEAIARIEHYTQGMDLEAFRNDQKTVDAAIRNLEIIGEAARHIPPEIEALYSSVPWAEMRGMRNILIHEYFGVSLPILWKTVTTNLPPLPPILERMLQEHKERP